MLFNSYTIQSNEYLKDIEIDFYANNILYLNKAILKDIQFYIITILNKKANQI